MKEVMTRKKKKRQRKSNPRNQRKQSSQSSQRSKFKLKKKKKVMSKKWFNLMKLIQLKDQVTHLKRRMLRKILNLELKKIINKNLVMLLPSKKLTLKLRKENSFALLGKFNLGKVVS